MLPCGDGGEDVPTTVGDDAVTDNQRLPLERPPKQPMTTRVCCAIVRCVFCL